jgi:hypothetical protein
MVPLSQSPTILISATPDPTGVNEAARPIITPVKDVVVDGSAGVD